MSVLTGALSDRRPPTADGVAPIRPPAGRRDRRMLRLVASVAVVGGSIAAFSALYSSADHKVPAMVVVQPVPQGHAITSADLGVAQVAVSADVAYLPLDQAGAVSGRRAAVSLAAGTLLTAADLSAAPAVAAADAVVGVALKDGSYPSSGLVPGDRVLVVQTAAPGTSLAPPGAAAAVAQVPVATGAIATAAPGVSLSTSGASGPGVLVPQATVFAVTVPTASSSGGIALLVSLDVPASVAAQIVTAAAAGQVGLVLLPHQVGAAPQATAAAP